MKTFFIALICLIQISAKSQIKKIDLQATGLTCSMCNKFIYKSLKTIANVDSIYSDLNTNTFSIFFKNAAIINIDELKQKVEVAGYKVGNLWLYINFSKTDIAQDAHLKMENNNFHFMDVKAQQLNGVTKVRVIDKGYITNKQLKIYEKLTTMNCYKTGYMETCCKVDVANAKQRIYHLTI